MSTRPIQRALVSVYDKTGLEDLARALHAAGVSLVSTGSTARTIEAAGVPVTPVEEVTGFPECLDGRVKTLHPRVHAGILADTRLEAHVAQLAELGVVEAALAAGGFTLEQRRRLAAQAFAHTAAYDVAVAEWFAAGGAGEGSADGDWPAFAGTALQRQAVLRYGENPHQGAALYSDGTGGLAAAEQLHGKEMSYNNYVDTDAARRAAYDHDAPAVAIIKHANPCGIAVGADVAEAHARAHACDPVSAFGGVIATNRPVSVAMAEQVAEVFTEVVVAPDYEPGAVEVLQGKKNIRILRAEGADRATHEVREISGGALAQQRDLVDAPGDDVSGWTLVAGEPADEATLADLAFAWTAVRAVKSNAILLAHDGASVGIGMGQVNRVDSCRLAVERAGEDRARGSVAASDAFFPFADGPQILIDAGVRAIVQPGGSMRDDETIAAAQAAGVTMYVTGTRHFFH